MRKSELGNLVAANMANIMESDEYRTLFHKQAETEAEKKEEEEKEEEAKEDKEEGEAKAKKAEFDNILNSVLKISEALDNLGLSKGASNMIKVANALLAEATGADTIEEMLKENPGLDVDLAVVKERSKEEPRLTDLEFNPGETEESVDPNDIVAQLEAIEEAGFEESLDIGHESQLSEEDTEKTLEIPGLEDIQMALAEVEVWLKKSGYSEKNDKVKLDEDLSTLLITAEKEIEDYLVDKNLSFQK